MADSYPPHSEPDPGQTTYQAEHQPAAAEYPADLPPPVSYPKRRRWRILALVLAAIVVVAGISGAIVYGVHNNHAAPGALTADNSSAAIQTYLNALSNADVDTIVRNTLCGMYDAVRDKRSDEALAKLSSDAFRKQFSKAVVTSIDKIVYWSPNQAQVLFTMQVVPVTRGARTHDEQGIAQVLSTDNEILVCSYLLRSAAVY